MSDTPRTDAAQRSRQWWTECYDPEAKVFLVDAEVVKKLERDLAQARAELEGVKKQRDEAERRAGIWMSLVHGLPNEITDRFNEAAKRYDAVAELVAATEEKCPICKGIPARPEIEGCFGCLECDFTGTKEAYEATQRFNHEAYEAAARSAEGARG